MKENKQKKKKMTMTKKLISFLFLNCTAIEIFTCWVIVQNLKLAQYNGTMLDFTPLVALVGAVVGEVIGFGVYALKSTKENTVGGVVYDKAMSNNEEAVG